MMKEKSARVCFCFFAAAAAAASFEPRVRSQEPSSSSSSTHSLGVVPGAFRSTSSTWLFLFLAIHSLTHYLLLLFLLLIFFPCTLLPFYCNCHFYWKLLPYFFSPVVSARTFCLEIQSTASVSFSIASPCSAFA